MNFRHPFSPFLTLLLSRIPDLRIEDRGTHYHIHLTSENCAEYYRAAQEFGFKLS